MPFWLLFLYIWLVSNTPLTFLVFCSLGFFVCFSLSMGFRNVMIICLHECLLHSSVMHFSGLSHLETPFRSWNIFILFLWWFSPLTCLFFLAGIFIFGYELPRLIFFLFLLTHPHSYHCIKLFPCWGIFHI